MTIYFTGDDTNIASGNITAASTTPNIVVGVDARATDLTGFVVNQWKDVLTRDFTKNAGTQVLVRALINFTYGTANDTDVYGCHNAHFVFQRKIGSGGYTNIGEPLDFTQLNADGDHDGKHNASGCFEYPDYDSTITNASGSVTYRLRGRFTQREDDDADASYFTVLEGSSLTIMEY